MRRHLAILFGGALGAVCRWWISAHLLPAAAFPVATFAINATGCFLLGCLLPYLLETEAAPALRLGVTTGFLGAYTTFSTWEEGVALLWRNGASLLAAAYLLGSLCAGPALAAAGMAVARRWTGGGAR